MEKLKYRLIRTVISKLMKKKCPRDIPEPQKVNCFYIFVTYPENSHKRLSVRSIDQDQVSGDLYNFDRIEREESIPISELDFSRILIRQNCYGDMNEYNGLIQFVMLVKYYEIEAHIRRITDPVCQFLFKLKPLVTHDRMVILRRLVEHYYEAEGQEINIIDLMCKLYTDRWLDHPTGEVAEAKLRLYLKSFVISGDVEEVGSENHHRVTGKAIITLEEYEKESRRNRWTDFLKWVMIILTIILALGTLIQAKVIKFNWFLDLSVACDKLQSFFH